MRIRADRPFLVIVGLLTGAGLFVLISASMGLLTRSGAEFTDVIARQIGLGLGLGFILMNVTSRLPYRLWQKFALPLFLGALFLTALVFVPGLGFEYAGARRWLSLGPVFFQPSEILKFGGIVFLASWLSARGRSLDSMRTTLLPFLGFLLLPALLLFLEPDLGTLGVFVLASLVLYLIAGGRKRHLLICLFLGCAFLAAAYALKPHARERISVFFSPAADPQGIGYQLQQSKIALGSGGLFGKGFGLSAQKFSYLPQPIGDSIFAVMGEEFGFVGVLVLLALFVAFLYRGLRIAARAPEAFGRLLGAGVVILITVQAYVNIAAMIGLIPLTGVPLTFVSQGGTALAVALAEVGVVLSVSKHRQRSRI